MRKLIKNRIIDNKEDFEIVLELLFSHGVVTVTDEKRNKTGRPVCYVWINPDIYRKEVQLYDLRPPNPDHAPPQPVAD